MMKGLMKETALVEVCRGTDDYQNQMYDEYTVDHVCLQPTQDVVKTTTNTEVQLVSRLFVDGKRSQPALNWGKLLRHAHEIGGDMYVTIREVRYTVVNCGEYRNGWNILHHWEVGLR